MIIPTTNESPLLANWLKKVQYMPFFVLYFNDSSAIFNYGNRCQAGMRFRPVSKSQVLIVPCKGNEKVLKSQISGAIARKFYKELLFGWSWESLEYVHNEYYVSGGLGF